MLQDTALTRLREDPRLAVFTEGVVCLVCGQTFRHLTNTHLAHHGLTSDAYKESFGYNSRRPLMAASVRRLHASNAVRRGLAEMIRRRPIVADPSLRARGRVARTLEETLTRRETRRHLVLPPRDATGRFVSTSVSLAGGVS